MVMAGAIQSFTSAALALADNGLGGMDLRETARDNIPDNIKQDFNLPKDMSGLEIDFAEVRTVDSMFKCRKPEWSGQDVLDLHLNMKKSSWVLSKMN
mmetsp:Transcript_20793/g.25444  ORF Transcript_20793/g.25444 Transcript_20793/m.25444 type:complete len:97 (+) Transcript_20793:104-394(+)